MATDHLVERLAAHTGRPASTTMQTSVTEATILVAALVGTSTPPAALVERATIETAAALIRRQDAPDGVQNFTDGMGGLVPVRVPRDPLTAARALLAPWLTLGFA